MSDEKKSYAGMFARGDFISFPGGDGEQPRQGEVLRAIGEKVRDPLIVIRTGEGPVAVRHASVLTMVTQGPRVVAEKYLDELPRLLWRREVSPGVAVAIDDTGAIVLDLGPGPRLPVHDPLLLIGAVHECWQFRSHFGAALHQRPDDFDQALDLAAGSFPYPPPDLDEAAKGT